MTAPSTPPVPVVVVPVEPTREMLIAGLTAPHPAYEPADPADVWNAMIAAAPDPAPASPEAIGGGSLGSSLRDTQPGADGAVVGDRLHSAIGKLRAHVVALSHGKREVSAGRPAPDPSPISALFRSLPGLLRELEMAEFDIEAAFERYEDAATPVQRGGEGWQPIETHDGSRGSVLIWCAERRNSYTAVWRDDEIHGDPGWFHFAGLADRLREVPTHWMPLPSAPTPAEQQDRNNG